MPLLSEPQFPHLEKRGLNLFSATLWLFPKSTVQVPLSKILFNWIGVRPRHGGFQKAAQVIVMDARIENPRVGAH